MPQIIAMACGAGYDGIELRFVEGRYSLWKLPAFCGKELAATKPTLSDHGMTISCLDTSCRFRSPDLFASAAETETVLESACPRAGAVWDPANCFLEARERPGEGAARLGAKIRHIHIKDLRQSQDGWKPALTGEGDFPLSEVCDALRQLGYDRFVSFEWEKRWHPEIADAAIALPHFVRWVREG